MSKGTSQKPSSTRPQVEKIAILLASLGEELATKLIQKLPPSDAQRILQTMAQLGRVDHQTIAEVQIEFKDLMKTFNEPLTEGAEAARRIIEKAFASEDAAFLLQAMPRPIPRCFREAERVDSKILWQILSKEHPQTLALILGYLSPQKAGELTKFMHPTMRNEVLMKLATITEVDPVLLDEIDEVLTNAIIAARNHKAQNIGGTKRAAEILAQLGAAQRQDLLSQMEKLAPDVAANVRAGIFTFEDISKLDRSDIEILLRSLDAQELELALRRCSDSVAQAFFAAMSERRAEQVRDNIMTAKPVAVNKIEDAQRKIAAKTAELIEKGTLRDPLDEAV